jgi:hypothetical protein
VLTAAGAAVFVSALTKSRWRNRSVVRRDSLPPCRRRKTRLRGGMTPRERFVIEWTRY